VGDVLVEHDAGQDSGIFDGAARNLLDLCVTLSVDLASALTVDGDGLDGADSNFASQIGPPVKN
jgi:hypothetical protein